MKNVLLTGNILLFVLLLMAYTNKNTSSFTNTTDPDPAQIRLGIEPALAKQMLEEYREKIWKNRIVNGARNKDARSVWFSLDKLKAFIKDIEEKVGTNCDSSYGLGIRIYYSVYPDSPIIKGSIAKSKYFMDHNLPMEYSNHHTVLMVPTYWNKKHGHNYDFDPRFRNRNGSCDFMQIKDVMDVLFSGRIPPNGPKFHFDSSVYVPNNKTYMVMPDNRDTRRFMPEYGFGNSNTMLNKAKSNKGGGDDEEYFNGQSDFTNGGSLIPPPYPSVDGRTASNFMKTPGTETNQQYGLITGQSGFIMASARDEDQQPPRIHIPSSGASYMRWVDGTNDTGWITPTISKQYEKLNKSVNLRQ